MFRRRFLTAAMVVVLGVSLVGLQVFTSRVQAAQTATVGGNALKISPVRMDLVMDPGATKTVQVFITNLTSVTTTLHGALNDFVAGDNESGTPNIILDESVFAPAHSLKRFVKPLGNMTLAPGEQRTVNVVISVPANAAGGGYYGAVRFAPSDLSGDKQLNLAASVATIVLLRVNGDIKENLSVASFDVRRGNNANRFYTSKDNLKAVVRFGNSGNIQVQPFGQILVKRFGKTVDKIEVNKSEPRGSVLPDSIRRFNYDLNKLSAFGKYDLEGNFGYGTSGQLLTAKASFYVAPLPLVLGVLVGLIILVILIVYVPKMVKSYNRRVVRRASGGRR